MNKNTPIVLSSLLALSLLAACAGSAPVAARDPNAPLPPGSKLVTTPGGEQYVEYTVTDADKAAVKSKNPLTTNEAVLVVNGLGCPQCASNVDIQLVRLPGVDRADVDLSMGTVTITMSGKDRPTPNQINEAVLDAGFTLVRVQEVN